MIGEKYLSAGQLKCDEPFANHTTFKIGGPAKIFFKVKRVEELIRALKFSQKFGLPYFILGGGSNILVGDLGFKGLVVKNETKEIKILGYKGKVQDKRSKLKNIFIQTGSGFPVNRLVRYTLNESLSGLENFLGLPGTVGGAIWTNAHNLKAGDFFGDHLFEARLLTPDGEIKKVTQDYFRFDYDQSKIQKTGDIVLSAIFQLNLGDKAKLWEKTERVMQHRLKTQPWGKFSAGCVFKNIKKSEALTVPTPGFATSAGFLIEAAGLKGKKIGEAQVSPRHANFIVNHGGATAADVLKLIDLIKKKVRERFGVTLEEEIEMVGEF